MFKVLGGDHKEYGPVTAEEIRRWIAEGRLNGQSQIQPDGGPWTSLASLPEFAQALRVQSAQPVSAQPATPPLNPAIWSAEILARQPRLQIGRCLWRGYALVKVNFGVLFGAAFLIWLVGLASSALPILLCIMGVIPAFVLASVLGLIYWVISGPLHGGLYVVYLNKIRSQPTSATAGFSGFGPSFAQLVLTGIVVSVLSGLGFCACVLPWIYLLVAWVFAIPLVADKRFEFWSAMELSRKVVSRVWFPLLGLLILAYLPFIMASLAGQVHAAVTQPPNSLSFNMSEPLDIGRILQMVSENYRANLGFVLIQLVLLINLPFATAALMYAYEDLFGPRSDTVGQAFQSR
ncbi:MAG: hypothetical protein C5B50_04430 [Verrucomicrobia bacterium]|nr:MAG: hypothetical protein C5B50_04430 [Verrucomicrobiota bacterium]